MLSKVWYGTMYGKNIVLSYIVRMIWWYLIAIIRSARHHTFHNNEEYYEIRGQDCYYSATSIYRVLFSSSFPAWSKREIRSSFEFARLSENSNSVPPSCSIKTVFGQETWIISLNDELQSKYSKQRAAIIQEI